MAELVHGFGVQGEVETGGEPGQVLPAHSGYPRLQETAQGDPESLPPVAPLAGLGRARVFRGRRSLRGGPPPAPPLLSPAQGRRRRGRAHAPARTLWPAASREDTPRYAVRVSPPQPPRRA